MKYYTLEEIIKVIEELLKQGWGELVVHIREGKIARYDKKESHQPEEE